MTACFSAHILRYYLQSDGTYHDDFTGNYEITSKRNHEALMTSANSSLLHDSFDPALLRISSLGSKLLHNWCEISGAFNCNGFNHSFTNYVSTWIYSEMYCYLVEFWKTLYSVVACGQKMAVRAPLLRYQAECYICNSSICFPTYASKFVKHLHFALLK